MTEVQSRKERVRRTFRGSQQALCAVRVMDARSARKVHSKRQAAWENDDVWAFYEQRVVLRWIQHCRCKRADRTRREERPWRSWGEMVGGEYGRGNF